MYHYVYCVYTAMLCMQKKNLKYTHKKTPTFDILVEFSTVQTVFDQCLLCLALYKTQDGFMGYPRLDINLYKF